MSKGATEATALKEPMTGKEEEKGTGCVDNACFCCLDGYDCSNITMVYKSEGEFLCLKAQYCLAMGESPLGCGLLETKAGEICVLGLPCCTYGLKTPTTCVDGWARCCCCYHVVSLPMSDTTFMKKARAHERRAAWDSVLHVT